MNTATAETPEVLLNWLSKRMLDKSPLQKRLVDAVSHLANTLNLDTWTLICARCEDPFGEMFYQCLAGDAEASVDVRTRRLALDGPSTSSATQFAMTERQPIVVANLTKETRFTDPILPTLRVASGIVAPILFEGRSFGAIGCWSSISQPFDREDVQLIQKVASIVSSAVSYDRLEYDLQRSEQLHATTVDSMACCFLILDADGRILTINNQVQELLGFEEDEVRGKSIISTLLTPRSAAEFDELLMKLQKPMDDVVQWTGETQSKHGDELTVQWNFGRMEGEDGSFTLIATGVDITDHLQAKKELRQMESQIAHVKRAAEELQTQAEVTRSVRTERRSSPRRPYPYVQSIAAQPDAEVVPPAHSFFEVRCRDISPDGFSFITYERPAFDRLVVSFGAAPSPILVSARVAHVTAMPSIEEGAYVVGCDYLGRIKNRATGEPENSGPAAPMI